jgi:hypothetical protein
MAAWPGDKRIRSVALEPLNPESPADPVCYYYSPAAAQRRSEKIQATIDFISKLCAFAPPREVFFWFSIFMKRPAPGNEGLF